MGVNFDKCSGMKPEVGSQTSDFILALLPFIHYLCRIIKSS